MKQRIVTGLLLAAGFLLLIYKAPASVVVAVVLGLATYSYVEFDRLFFRVKSSTRQIRIVILVAASILAARISATHGWIALWTCFIVFCVSQIIFWRGRTEYELAVRAVSLEWLGYTYVLGLFGFLVPIYDLPNGPDYVLLLALIVFGGDTIAYFVGSRWGKRKLSPQLSPKKSIEGACAAIVCSMIVPIIWHKWVISFPTEDSFLLRILIVSPLLSILAQVGDLFESLLKRSQSIKDTGSFLPGHGGILDRVDGLALAAPFYYAYLIHILGAAT